jgi:hypothetical protein
MRSGGIYHYCTNIGASSRYLPRPHFALRQQRFNRLTITMHLSTTSPELDAATEA